MLPLGFNQERHLVIEETLALQGRTPTGARMPLIFRFTGLVDRERVQRALNTIVRRHSALSSAYRPNDRYSKADRMLQLNTFARTGLFVPGLYVQRTEVDACVTVHERHIPNENALAELVRQDLTTSLNTDTGPLIRATLVSTDSGSVLLVLVITHYTMDGWSVVILAREFTATYGNLCAALPEVEIQCHHFAAWQLRQFREGRFAAAERYWHQQWAELSDARIQPDDVPFAFPLHHPPIAFPEQRLVSFSADETKHMRSTIADLRLTPYVLFRTAMTMVLHYYTRKRRLAFWANFANRRHPEFMATLGWYSNTHVVTVAIDPSMTYAALAQRVAAAVKQAQAHEALPLSALWQRLGYNLDAHRIRINFDVYPRRQHTADSSLVELIESPVGPRGMDLDIRLRDDVDVFALVANFNPERYDAAGIDALVASIRQMVLAFADTPDRRVSECERFMTPEAAAHQNVTSIEPYATGNALRLAK